MPDRRTVGPDGDFCSDGILFRVKEPVLPDIRKYIREEAAGKISRHRKVHIQIVAAVSCGGPRDLPFERRDEGEHFLHERYDIGGSVIPCEKQVETGPASHGAEIDYLILKGIMIPQKSSSQMLDGVDFRRVHDRLIVGACHADIKCRDDGAVHIVLSGDVDARFQADMVNGKTCDLFHGTALPFSVICPVYYSFSESRIQGGKEAKMCRRELQKYRAAGILKKSGRHDLPALSARGGIPMILYIVRHGETDWNKRHKVQGRTDIPLNDYGRRLAEETGEGMRDIPVDLGVTSPLLRAKETAQIILDGRDIPLYEDERLQEISFGRYEGMYCGGEHRDPESEAFNRFFNDTGHYVPPEGAETIPQLYERTGQFLEELMNSQELQDKSLLVSTHGAAMTSLLNRIRGNLTAENFWRDEVPPNCSVTKVEIKDGQARILEEGLIFYKEKVKKWKTV